MIMIHYAFKKGHFNMCLNGHAEYAEAGKDIVCAAVSVLISELLLAIDKAEENNEIHDCKSIIKSGYALIAFSYDSNTIVKYVAELIVECLSLIEKEYPKNIQIKKEAG